MLEWRLQFGTCGGSKDGSRLKIARVPGSFPAVFQLDPSWELPQVPKCSLYSILVAHRSEGHPKSLRGALRGAPHCRVGQLSHDQNVQRGSVVQILLEFLLYLITKVLQMLMVGTLGSIVTLMGWVGQFGHD